MIKGNKIDEVAEKKRIVFSPKWKTIILWHWQSVFSLSVECSNNEWPLECSSVKEKKNSLFNSSSTFKRELSNSLLHNPLSLLTNALHQRIFCISITMNDAVIFCISITMNEADIISFSISSVYLNYLIKFSIQFLK